MKSTTVLRTFALGLLLGAVPALAEWHFAIPPGWADLSPGKPIPKDVPEELSILTQSGQFHTYGMDLAGRAPKFAANFNAIVRPAALVANEQVLNDAVPAMLAEAAREVPSAKVVLVEKSVVPVAGQPSLRFVVDVTDRTLKMRLLRYAIPGGEQTAILTYAATPETFGNYLPAFEASAQQTQGAAAPPLGRRIGARLREWGGDSLSADDWTRIFSLAGRLIGILAAVGLFNFFRKRTKKSVA